MPDAVKFVEENGEWFIEGLILPLGGPVIRTGNDFTGSRFTKDTDFCLDWFPDGGRPGLYSHGFDPDLEASVIGREVKSYDVKGKGRWLRAQLDKAHEYAVEVKELVEKGAVGLSSGAVDHLTIIAAGGAIKRWPWVEWSLTPIPANPEGIAYSVKSADVLLHLAVVGAAPPDAIKEAEPIEPAAEEPLAVEPSLRAVKAEIAPAMKAFSDAVKEGRRNSATDAGHIQSAHDAMVALGAKCSPDMDDMPASTKDATAETVPEPAAMPLIGIKAAEAVPNVDLDAMREQLAAHAIKVAQDLLRT